MIVKSGHMVLTLTKTPLDMHAQLSKSEVFVNHSPPMAARGQALLGPLRNTVIQGLIGSDRKFTFLSQHLFGDIKPLNLPNGRITNVYFQINHVNVCVVRM